MQIYNEKQQQNGISMEAYLEKRRIATKKRNNKEHQEEFILQQMKATEWFMIKSGRAVHHRLNP